jgi:hypothetical protein
MGDKGSYLVRNRRVGQSFTLGAEEHFLLARLDGTRTTDELCAAFAERFGEPLTQEELQDFLELAHDFDFLQPEGVPAPPGANGFHADGWEAAPRTPKPRHTHSRRVEGPALARQSAWTRPAAVLLQWLAGVLQWLGGLLNAAAKRLQSLKLARLDFVPRPDDIFIVTYPRSGTTWLQMILYQLTTDGSMDFPHIAEYCPWFEQSIRSGCGFEGRPSPRLFKSHLPYRQIPKGRWSEKGDCSPKTFSGPKCIYVARDGKDVAVSYYHLYRSHNAYQGTFAEFFDQFLRGQVGSGSWFAHVRGWWRHRHDPNVLFLQYEDLLADLEGCVRRIIAFCDLDVAPERLPTILERCSFAFMKRHECKFDHLTGTLWEQGLQLNAFLRSGRAGDSHGKLSPLQEARFEKAFQQQLGRTGIHFTH